MTKLENKIKFQRELKTACEKRLNSQVANLEETNEQLKLGVERREEQAGVLQLKSERQAKFIKTLCKVIYNMSQGQVMEEEAEGCQCIQDVELKQNYMTLLERNYEIERQNEMLTEKVEILQEENFNLKNLTDSFDKNAVESSVFENLIWSLNLALNHPM